MKSRVAWDSCLLTMQQCKDTKTLKVLSLVERRPLPVRHIREMAASASCILSAPCAATSAHSVILHRLSDVQSLRTTLHYGEAEAFSKITEEKNTAVGSIVATLAARFSSPFSNDYGRSTRRVVASPFCGAGRLECRAGAYLPQEPEAVAPCRSKASCPSMTSPAPRKHRIAS